MSVAKWGVLGCAGIASKSCKGMREAGQEIVAVGSRSKDKAEAWLQSHAPGATAYGSYDEVLDDTRVQVVYIPLPTMMKKEWVLKAAAKGKHVLCEKPLAMTMEETHEMIDACTTAGVQWMDNTMFMHNTRLTAMKKVLNDSATFGKVKTAISSFSIPFGNDPEWASNIRLSAATEPLGCLGDLGWYNVRFSLWAFDFEMPEEVSCFVLEANEEGVPITAQSTLKYSGGRYAAFDCSFKSSLRQWAEVVGEKHTLSFTDMVITDVKDQSKFEVSETSIGELSEEFHREVKHEGKESGCIQHVELARKMAELVVGGELDGMWPKVSIQTQQVLLALHSSGKKNGQWVKP